MGATHEQPESTGGRSDPDGTDALNISADELLCDLVPSASHVTDDEISKRLEGLTPMQKKVALDLLDTYITNLPYLTKEE